MAEGHEYVLKDPAPAALFMGFGDNALNIELRAFIGDLGNKLTVADQLHLGIDAAYREAGIEIVFPQRDVNLKTPKPMEVKVITSGDGKADREPRVVVTEE